MVSMAMSTSLQQQQQSNVANAMIQSQQCIRSTNSKKDLVIHKKTQVKPKVMKVTIPLSKHMEGELQLQSSGKRRRYPRRGSKTPFMLRDMGAVMNLELPMSFSLDGPSEPSVTWGEHSAHSPISPHQDTTSPIKGAPLPESMRGPTGHFLSDLPLPFSDSQSSPEKPHISSRRSTISLLASALNLCDIQGGVNASVNANQRQHE